jgi:signal transduction histidine kinase
MEKPRTSIHRKLMLIVLGTAAVALLITGTTMAIYDLGIFKQRWESDLTAQADILGLAAAPALEFEDPKAAQDYLELMKVRPTIIGAAIYTAKGARFASYVKAGHEELVFPPIPEIDGSMIRGSQLVLFKRIVSDGEILGTVYIRAQFDLVGRLLDYLGIIGVVMGLSMVAAWLISRRLQQSVTRPILEVSAVARKVMEERDFTLTATKTTDDEIGVLVDAFNSMLAEIAARTEVLEKSNLYLQHEIGERQRTEGALQESETRLLTLNAELESRVAARTAQLEAVNKDLESFSYSVSHDLRAPIRAIGGFSTLLIEDHQAHLDDEARRKLGIIASEARRMGQLIDDLLAFSRLGRRALDPTDLNMAEMAKNVYERLNHVDPDKPVDFRLSSMPHAKGDRGLFEQVWVNLISNALKFSGKKDKPVIEVGGISEEHEHVFFVRDNGAGFDPRYLAKLFGVFQRLHRDDEFPGTGVGLALVHRIVTRHGGRVWADGKPGEGATFHFSLPKEPLNGGV